LKTFFSSRRATLFATSYLAAVVTCAVFAFRPSDLFSIGWFVAVTCLTLPWSLLSWLFVWAFIHDNTHYFAMSVHIGWGFLNSLLALWVARKRRLSNLTHASGNA
jgi:hypothetical protein